MVLPLVDKFAFVDISIRKLRRKTKMMRSIPKFETKRGMKEKKKSNFRLAEWKRADSLFVVSIGIGLVLRPYRCGTQTNLLIILLAVRCL